MPRLYAGIGARATPPEVLSLMTRAAFALTKHGYVLRSGHAIGADSTFERGAGRNPQIFLPAAGWRGSASEFHPGTLRPEVWDRARTIAAAHHPAFAGLSAFVQALHTRNVFQVLGTSLDSPAEFVLCWTADGEASGGTGEALPIAASHGVPVFNLQRERERAHVERHLADPFKSRSSGRSIPCPGIGTRRRAATRKSQPCPRSRSRSNLPAPAKKPRASPRSNCSSPRWPRTQKPNPRLNSTRSLS
ncbi:hypothetical protein [Novosphingobium sp. THN1]|uniref:hypothetical protein n=1 Tax=Novosphingobium sp. THN1 TaxID=1016987 RepID=UPI001F077B8D|nr:hypothetical protein [Novosphingobium sp. THN1]